MSVLPPEKTLLEWLVSAMKIGILVPYYCCIAKVKPHFPETKAKT